MGSSTRRWNRQPGTELPRRRLRLVSLCALLVAFFGCAAVRDEAGAQVDTQQNVIVVVMDGVRYSDTFGDESHVNIPYIWNVLRPQGAVYTSFYNHGQTLTAGAHASLLTGNDQWLDQIFVTPPYPEWALSRPYSPTLFEYYRAATGAPQNSVWLVANHVGFLQETTYSLHPAYGADYGASWMLGSGSDLLMMLQVRSLMDAVHPNLMVVNLHETDKFAHQGDYPGHLAHIKLDDWLVYQLWQKINLSSFYRGRTTLIVTTDHGRHTTDYTNHGDCCDGCQHIMLLALGPNIEPGYVGTVERHINDLATTIAALMDIPAPYAAGSSVMQEMLVSASGDYPPAEPVLDSLALTVVPLNERFVPTSVFRPGEGVILAVFAKNVGTVPATVYQGTLSWTACCEGTGGVSLTSDPLRLGVGEVTMRWALYQVPAEAPAGTLPIICRVNGLDDNGRVVTGASTVPLVLLDPTDALLGTPREDLPRRRPLR